MRRQIIKQIWNRKKINVWLFLEVTLVSFFLWFALDPMYVLLSNRYITDGFSLDHVYRIQLGEYDSQHFRYDETAASDSMKQFYFYRIAEAVESYPGVEAWTVTDNMSYPYSGGYYTPGIIHDSLECYSLFLQILGSGRLF